MKKPNVIFLLQDQMQQQVLRQDSNCLMPNLHRLIDDSVLFEQAHTCNAICSPARASLLTGTLPHVHGMVDCTHTVPSYRADFNDKLDTVTQAFHDEGYAVSYYGKWHIERTHKLEKFGIDVYETEKDIPGFPVTMKDKVLISTPGYEDKLVCGVFKEDSTFTEEHYIYQKAIAQIEHQCAQNKPFCTFISTYAPHDPYCVPEEIYRQYEGRDLPLPPNYYDSMQDKPAIYRRMREALGDLSIEEYRKVQRCYYSYCTLVDIQIGKLIAFLKEHSLYDNTLIVCLSDHGDMMGAHGLMMKSIEPFEEVYKIPLLMKLPHQKRAGQKSDFYFSTYEVASTVLELAQCRPLKGENIGVSMVPWIEEQRQDKHYAFAEFFGQRYSFTQRILWENNLKYVFNAFDEDELYDLALDPYEITNLNHQADYAARKIELCKHMWEHMKASKDATMSGAEYYLLRISPVGPGPKSQDAEYSMYNKKF